MSTRLDRCAPTATKTASKPPSLALGVEVLDPVPARDRDAQRRDPVDLAVEDVARQPVGRDAVAHHPARLGPRVADLDLVAEPGQVVGGRQPARPGADDEHPLAGAGRRRVERPAVLEREVAEEPLDRVDRDRRCRGSRGCRRSRTGGSRPARGSPAAGCRRPAGARPARGGRPRRARARPGCSRRPGSRRCTAAAGRRRRGGARAPGRSASARAPGRAAASRPAAARSWSRRHYPHVFHPVFRWNRERITGRASRRAPTHPVIRG